MGISLVLGNLDSSIVNLSLPILVQKLDTDFEAVQRMILAYLLTATALLKTMGRLGDLRGKKVIFLSRQVIFALDSLL